MAEGFHDFAALDVLTAANTDDYLMRQTVMRFASAAARDSALSGVVVEGMCAYLKDVNSLTTYDGTSWWTTALVGNAATSYSSSVVLAQAGAVASTIVISEYRIVSGVCEWWFVYTATASGASGNAVTLLLPVTAAAASLRNVGAGIINDSSGVTVDSGSWELLDTTHIVLETSRGTSSVWGATPNLGIANGDSLRGHVRYLVASAA